MQNGAKTRLAIAACLTPAVEGGALFPAQNLIHQPIGPRVAGKTLPQGGFVIGALHPFQERDFGIGLLKGGEAFEESVQNAGA